MTRFLIVVNATSRVVQNCRAAKFLLDWHDYYGGFVANEERKNYMHSSRSSGQLSGNVITCNANSCSGNQWNNGPRWAGITNIVHMRAGKGGSEQVVRHSSKKVGCIQNRRTFPDTWRYTCYVPRNSENSASHRAPFY